ncbi:MAG: gamma-glutamyl-gamma-aminobutyrate hydrolase family protein [Candidatus Dormibacteria bacterium]
MAEAPGPIVPAVLVPAQVGRKVSGDQDPVPVQTLNRAYVAALQQVGLLPVLVPTRSRLPEDLSWARGLLLPGGADVDPLRYGRGLESPTQPDPESDQLEFQLLEWALAQEVPILAICRGLQVLNVGLGGTLVQDLPQHHPTGEGGSPVRDEPAHPLRVERSTRLGEIVGLETLVVNSLHHQGVEELAPALRASAWAPDGLIEGAEMTDRRFAIGVQYHPEELFARDPSARALFRAFAEVCGAGGGSGQRVLAELAHSN